MWTTGLFGDAVKQADEYAYDENGNLAKDLNRKIGSIAYNSLNLLGKVTFTDGSTITYTYAADNPVRNIDVNGDSVRVYVETRGEGHSWLSVGEGDDMIVYSYGRYNGTFKGQKGINFANQLANGDGVLLRLTNEARDNYFKEKRPLGMETFVIKDIKDTDVQNYLDEMFYSSDLLIDNAESQYYKNAHIINKYELLNRNCTTMVSDILNRLNSKALKGIKTSFFAGYLIPSFGKKRFILPLALKNHLMLKSIFRSDIVSHTNK